MDIGMKIKKLKLDADMTRGKPGKDLDIGVSTLSGCEVGSRNPDLETLCRIADYLNVSTDYLLGSAK